MQTDDKEKLLQNIMAAANSMVNNILDVVYEGCETNSVEFEDIRLVRLDTIRALIDACKKPMEEFNGQHVSTES